MHWPARLPAEEGATPSRIGRIRAPRPWAKSRSCVAIRTAAPESAAARSAAETAVRAAGSSPRVGSSIRSTWGSSMVCSAMARILRSPAERSRGCSCPMGMLTSPRNRARRDAAEHCGGSRSLSPGAAWRAARAWRRSAARSSAATVSLVKRSSEASGTRATRPPSTVPPSTVLLHQPFLHRGRAPPGGTTSRHRSAPPGPPLHRGAGSGMRRAPAACPCGAPRDLSQSGRARAPLAVNRRRTAQPPGPKADGAAPGTRAPSSMVHHESATGYERLPPGAPPR